MPLSWQLKQAAKLTRSGLKCTRWTSKFQRETWHFTPLTQSETRYAWHFVRIKSLYHNVIFLKLWRGGGIDRTSYLANKFTHKSWLFCATTEIRAVEVLHTKLSYLVLDPGVRNQGSIREVCVGLSPIFLTFLPPPPPLPPHTPVIAPHPSTS